MIKNTIKKPYKLKELKTLQFYNLATGNQEPFYEAVELRSILKAVYGELKSKPVISGCYAIFCNDEKNYYIGSSMDIKKRISAHISELWRGWHTNGNLQMAFDKYGVNSLKFIVLEECKADKDALIESENKWMDIVRTFSKKELYNVQPQAGITMLYHIKPCKYIREEEQKIKVIEDCLKNKFMDYTQAQKNLNKLGYTLQIVKAS